MDTNQLQANVQLTHSFRVQQNKIKNITTYYKDFMTSYFSREQVVNKTLTSLLLM